MALAGDHVVVMLDDSAGTLRTFDAGDIISVDIPLTYDMHDVTGFGAPVHNFVQGQIQSPVTIRGYLTTTANVGTHTVLRDVYQQGKQVSLEVRIGLNAAPTTGNPKFTGEFIVESYKPSLDTGKAVTFEAVLKPATTTAPAWDVI